MEKTKQFTIPKHLVMKAFKLVKSNAGSAGIDKQSLQDFEKSLKDNLYKLWNRLSSGTYFPPPVKAVPIPKKLGGERVLGVPTVSDRIAQMVVRLVFEPEVEPHFLNDSYGYRPNKSALDAVSVTRQRCWKHDWVLEFDIKGLFDNISHELLMKAVKKHTENKWVRLYVERWLKTPMQMPNGSLQERTKGTMQGGVISPLLSNLFLHYVFDTWMQRKHPIKKWCRYADDGLVHCNTESDAKALLTELERRFAECSLQLHPDKTKIIYCRDKSRKGKYDKTSFDFLGYTFRPRVVKNQKTGEMFVGFTPAVSKSSKKSIRSKMKLLRCRRKTELSLEEIADRYNPKLRGWINYYGRFNRSALYPVLRTFNKTLVDWAMRKYKRFGKGKTQAARYLMKIAEEKPETFVHWEIGMVGSFA